MTSIECIDVWLYTALLVGCKAWSQMPYTACLLWSGILAMSFVVASCAVFGFSGAAGPACGTAL
jgi:hypothetical protein